MDKLMDFVVQAVIIMFGLAVMILVPVWAWFMFRLYVPKRDAGGSK